MASSSMMPLLLVVLASICLMDTILAGGPVITTYIPTTAEEITTGSDYTTGSDTTASDNTVSDYTGTTLVDDVTGVTIEVTSESYVDAQLVWCREYLLNNTDWEPYPTYSDNSGAEQTVLNLMVVGVLSTIAALV